MGSKRLKAIVAWGTRRPKRFSKGDFIDAGSAGARCFSRAFYTAAKRKKSVGHGEEWDASTKNNWRNTVMTDENRGLSRQAVTLLRSADVHQGLQ